jgi:hypothetical protein
MSELLSSIVKVFMDIWVAHGALVCLQRSIALLSHDLGPKSF